MLKALCKWVVHSVAFKVLVSFYVIEAQTAAVVEWYLERKDKFGMIH